MEFGPTRIFTQIYAPGRLPPDNRLSGAGRRGGRDACVRDEEQRDDQHQYQHGDAVDHQADAPGQRCTRIYHRHRAQHQSNQVAADLELE